MKRFGMLLMSALLIFACATPAVQADDGAKVLVFAAASTTNAVTEVCDLFNKSGKGEAVPSFASSSTLAKQIESGAPANIFISANPKWMNYLDDKDMIDKATRKDMFGNRVVLIAPADSSVSEVDIKEGFPLADMLGDGRLALGDPDHVPAGIYSKQSLESLGVWAAVEPKVARSKDVRAALALVERGECPFGMVYATDAAISKKVKVVGMVPETVHPPIIYPAAIVTKDAGESVKAFFELLQSPESKAIFERYGFKVR